MNTVVKKILFTITAFILFISFFSVSPKSVQASGNHSHIMKFYLDPTLVPDMNFAKEVLPKYVEDMNYMLSVNTNRQLMFDPETGIVLTETQPHTGTAGSLPTHDYEIWAHAVYTDYQISHGGHMSFDVSGAGVMAGLNWTTIFDPDTLVANTTEMRDYWTQIHHMLHEMAHIYGAGMGEYYNLIRVDDTTGVDPILDIRLDDPDDSYWSVRTNFFADPLLQNIYNKSYFAFPTDLTSLLQKTLFSDLTAAIMNGDYRNPPISFPMPDFDNIRLRVVDSNQNPLHGVNVKIWNVRTFPPYVSELILESTTDLSGELIFAWGGTGSPHGNYNHLRLIKLYHGESTPKAFYVSSFDAEEISMVRGQTQWTIETSLEETMKDIINITKAMYRANKKELFIEAASSEGGIAILSTYGFEMKYKAKKDKYELSIHGVDIKPDTVTVTSNLGGEDTVQVTQKGGGKGKK